MSLSRTLFYAIASKIKLHYFLNLSNFSILCNKSLLEKFIETTFILVVGSGSGSGSDSDAVMGGIMIAANCHDSNKTCILMVVAAGGG